MIDFFLLFLFVSLLQGEVIKMQLCFEARAFLQMLEQVNFKEIEDLQLGKKHI